MDSYQSDMRSLRANVYARVSRHAPRSPPPKLKKQQISLHEWYARLPQQESQSYHDPETGIEIPKLLNNTLPPVCPERQIGYERVVEVLRERWIQSRGETRLEHLAALLWDELSVDAAFRPIHNKPWRRASVMEFEIEWAKWLMYEAMGSPDESLITIEVELLPQSE